MSSAIARRAAISVAVAAIAVGAAATPAHAQDFVVPSCGGFDVGITFDSAHGNPINVGPYASLARTKTVQLGNNIPAQEGTVVADDISVSNASPSSLGS